MKFLHAVSVVALACLFASPSQGRPAGGGYTIVARDSIGGEGGWDLLTEDPASHRLFVGRSTRVQAIDVTTGKVVGEVLNTPGVRGIALAPEFGRGYTSNGRDSSVTVFDLATYATIGRIPLDAKNPDDIIYEPVSKRIFVFNAGSNNAAAIDAATDSVVGYVALISNPETGVSDEHGQVFVNLEDTSMVARFDARTLVVTAIWPLAPGEKPTGLAIDQAHHRLFSGCANERMVVLDSETGHVVTSLPIGKGVDATAFDPATGLAFSSNGEGTLTVVHEDSPARFSVAATVPTQRGARTLALDPVTHRIYLATASFGETPAATPENPHPRPVRVPNSFVILVMAPSR